jgi:hypothetical protein
MTLTRKTPMARTSIKAARATPAPVGVIERKAKPKKSKRSATAAERAHMAAVAALGCCLCSHCGLGHTPAEVHHVRVLHGWGRSGHLNTIPLCVLHHRYAPFGIHSMGREEFTERYGISEIELLDAVTRQLSGSAA